MRSPATGKVLPKILHVSKKWRVARVGRGSDEASRARARRASYKLGRKVRKIRAEILPARKRERGIPPRPSKSARNLLQLEGRIAKSPRPASRRLFFPPVSVIRSRRSALQQQQQHNNSYYSRALTTNSITATCDTPPPDTSCMQRPTTFCTFTFARDAYVLSHSHICTFSLIRSYIRTTNFPLSLALAFAQTASVRARSYDQ